MEFSLNHRVGGVCSIWHIIPIIRRANETRAWYKLVFNRKEAAGGRRYEEQR
jgi:hypothetical protein